VCLDYGVSSAGFEHIPNKTSRGESHCGLAIYIKKGILRQKKNYGNSNISPCKNIILYKKPKSFKIL
jgi:hypothetical protein